MDGHFKWQVSDVLHNDWFSCLFWAQHTSRHKATLVSDGSSGCAALGSERLRHTVLCCSTQRPSYICYLFRSLFFFFFFLRAPRNIFKLSIFKHYLLAVKKIDPLRARGWRRRRRGLKRGLKIAQPLDSCSYWKQSPLLTPLRLSTSALQLDLLRSSLLGTDATGSRPEQSPS